MDITMKRNKTVSLTQEQAIASWAEHLNSIRANALIDKLARQDHNIEEALKELQKVKEFLSTPNHILGSPLTKHGEVAEQMQVRFSNAESLVEGKQPAYSFDGVPRTDMTDYLKNGEFIQAKFCNGIKSTFDHIRAHLDDYPNFLREGGSYEIPKDQHAQIIDILRRGDTARSTLRKTEWGNEETLYKTIKEWERIKGVRFEQVVKPAKVDYDAVQLNNAENTIGKEEKTIKDTDKRIRDEATHAARPTFQEGLKVTGISAALEGGLSFVLGVYRKRKKGIRLKEYSKEDWKDVGIDTLKGTVKGAIRGSAVYVLSNFTPVPAPIASALVTATLGVVAQSRKLQKGDITPEEFIDISEAMCLDVSVSALASLLGSYLIPVPILGSIVGNITGMFMLNISRVYLSAVEEKLIRQYLKEAEIEISAMDDDYRKAVTVIDKELSLFNSLVDFSFSEKANQRFQLSIAIAQTSGVSEDRILKSKEEIDSFFLS